MRVNGLVIPEPLALVLASGRLAREQGSWALLRDNDAYGNPLETELGSVFQTEDQLSRASRSLPEQFSPDGYYASPTEDDRLPGTIDDIVDFSQVVCFGAAGDGSPFCLDFRNDLHKPSVIWWDDDRWRRIAPDAESFLALFKLV